MNKDDFNKTIVTLLLIRDQIGKMKLWKTYHKLGEAIDTMGWEFAKLWEEQMK